MAVGCLLLVVGCWLFVLDGCLCWTGGQLNSLRSPSGHCGTVSRNLGNEATSVETNVSLFFGTRTSWIRWEVAIGLERVWDGIGR